MIDAAIAPVSIRPSAVGNAKMAFSHFDPERNRMNIRLISSLAACAALCAMAGTTRAQIFVTNTGSGTIGEYTTSGVPVNPALISGLNYPVGIALSGGNLFVANGLGSTIGKYTTSGALQQTLDLIYQVIIRSPKGR